jgi:hypothetical protein
VLGTAVDEVELPSSATWRKHGNVAFEVRAGAATECPMCSHPMVRDNQVERLPLIPLICNNCGFVRLVDERRTDRGGGG